MISAISKNVKFAFLVWNGFFEVSFGHIRRR